jgi:hypothetical protein
MSTNPAYHIPVSADGLRMVGEICAIQGQIEFLLQRIVKQVLDLDFESTLAIMTASNSLKTTSRIALLVIKRKCADPETIKLAEDAFAQVEDLTKGRNDFVHAVYATGQGKTGAFSLSSGDAQPILTDIVAVRTANRKHRPAGEIAIVRDQAARLSCALADLFHILTCGRDAPSPWRGKY